MEEMMESCEEFGALYQSMEKNNGKREKRQI
jgi:hypothetical protein